MLDLNENVLADLQKARESFESKGYAYVRNAFGLIHHGTSLERIKQQMDQVAELLNVHDGQSPAAKALGYDFESEKLMINMMPLMEHVTGLKLFPTYAYARIYLEGSTLKPHLDRPACEISASICYGYQGDYSWPLWVQDVDGNNVSLSFEPGDMMIYRGCERLHWRKPADARVIRQHQAFIHYVDQNGPYTYELFDRKNTRRSNPRLDEIYR